MQTVGNRGGGSKKDAMHIQFIWEQHLLMKWLIKKSLVLRKLKEKKEKCTAIQMEDEKIVSGVMV